MDPFENEKTTKLLIRLKRQEILLESFKNHINKILKEIRKGECNFLLINQLSQFIVYYYKKNLISLNEDESDKDIEEEDKDTKEEDKTEESDKDIKEEDKTEESDKDTKDKDTKEEEDKTEESDDDKSIKQNQDTLFNHFMNNSNLKKKSLFNPNYDINENIIIFIRNSLIY